MKTTPQAHFITRFDIVGEEMGKDASSLNERQNASFGIAMLDARVNFVFEYFVQLCPAQ